VSGTSPPICIALLLGAGTATAAGAQDWSPGPTLNVDSILARVEAVVDGTLSFGNVSPVYDVSTVISLSLGDGGCARLLPDIDPGDALREVFLQGMRHPVPEVAGPVLRFAGERAFREQDQLDWSPLELHLEAIRAAGTESLRKGVVHGLLYRSGDPEVRVVLLEMARSPIGPPELPDLPAWLMLVLQMPPSPAAQGLVEELLSAPELVRNPRARWNLTCRSRHGPLSPQDPCHPSNAPPAGPPGG